MKTVTACFRRAVSWERGRVAIVVIAACNSALTSCVHLATASVRITAADSVVVAKTELSVDSTVPAGEVAGIVVDAYRDTPLPHTEIFVVYSGHKPHAIQGVSDENGRFHLTGLETGAGFLGGKRIGYRTESISITGDRGYVARIGMHGESYDGCGVIVTGVPAPALTAVVRDSRTGQAPSVATMRVRDGRYSDAITASPEGTDSILKLQAAPEREGFYVVAVTAPGYKPWSVSDVRVGSSDCHGFEGRTLQVWLLPN